MNKRLAFLLCTAVLFACGSDPVPPVAETGATGRGTSATTTHDARAAGIPGLIIGQGVRVRQDSLLKSAELTQLSSGEAVEILRVTTERFTADDKEDFCESNPMVNVRLADGKTGWIFGKYVYQLTDNTTKFPSTTTVELGNRRYELKLVENYSIGANDDSQSCDDFFPVVLYENASKKAHLVELAKSQNAIEKIRYWTLEDDAGGVENITRIESGQSRATAEVFTELQEGCQKYRVDIVFKNNRFIGTATPIMQSYDEKDCR